MTRDRFDYTEAVAESWKSQMLLNLVKIRYGDAPVFLEHRADRRRLFVQRSLSGSRERTMFNGSPAPGTAVGSFGLSAAGSYNDSPTITYSPLSGERFARSLMMPIPPSAIVNVMEAGFDVREVFRLSVQSVNGIDNRRVEGLSIVPADPEFYALLRTFGGSRPQATSACECVQPTAKSCWKWCCVSKLAAAVENARLNVARILALDPAARVFRLVYRAVPPTTRRSPS